MIAFVPDHAEAYAAGQRAFASQAASMARDAEALAATAQTPLPTLTGQTLYQAMDAYSQFVEQRDAKEWNRKEAAATKRLKQSHPDIPLSQFGISSLERIAAYWASRPNAKRTGRPMALDSISSILKTARRFVRWLHRSAGHAWGRLQNVAKRWRPRSYGWADGYPVWGIRGTSNH